MYFDNWETGESYSLEYGPPGFISLDSNNFNLSQSSPCIDAGHPDLDGDGISWENDPDDQDPDGTRLDMGALPFDLTDVNIISSSSDTLNFGLNQDTIGVRFQYFGAQNFDWNFSNVPSMVIIYRGGRI